MIHNIYDIVYNMRSRNPVYDNKENLKENKTWIFISEVSRIINLFFRSIKNF